MEESEGMRFSQRIHFGELIEGGRRVGPRDFHVGSGIVGTVGKVGPDWIRWISSGASMDL